MKTIKIKEYNLTTKEWEYKEAKLLEIGNNEGARVLLEGRERWIMQCNIIK